MTLIEVDLEKVKRARRARQQSEPAGVDRLHDDGLPVIQIVQGEFPRMVDEAAMLLADPEAGIFKRGTRLVRPARVGKQAETLSLAKRGATIRREGSVILAPVDSAALREVLGRRANWERYDERKSGWVRRDAPEDVARGIVARQGFDWPMRELKAVVRSPILRTDGTVLTTPGFDPKTQVLFMSDEQWPAIPERPTRDDARDGLDFLASLIRGLPVVSNTDTSAILALLLTALVRPVLPTSPLFAITAPTPGTGKSLAVELASILQTGKRPAIITVPSDNDELEKRVGASLIAGDQVVTLDNISMPLDSDFLCSVLSQETVRVRVLGESRNVDSPTAALFAATGNNLAIKGDLCRRVVLIKLDAKIEKPESRVFDWDATEEAQSRRVEYVSAGLTALRAFIVSGATQHVPPFGNFEDWSKLIRGTLLWCGYPDPLGNAESVRAEDPERQRLLRIFTALRPLGSFKAGDLPMLLSGGPLNDVLAEFSRNGAGFNVTAFSMFCRRHKDRPVGEMTLRRVNRPTDAVAVWEVV